MNVIDGLAAVVAGVDDGAVSAGQALGTSDFSRGPVQVAEKLVVLLLHLRNGGDVPARDDENVHGRLRFDVSERIAVVILINRFGWNASIDDLAEEAAHD